MKKANIILLTLLIFAFVLVGCKKDEKRCANDAEFCSFVNSEQLNETGTVIDNFLKQQDSKLSDIEKLEELKNWLACKSCVEMAEILCNSCIFTLPPQSELKVTFISDGQQNVKILDILMDEPLKFAAYHD